MIDQQLHGQRLLLTSVNQSATVELLPAFNGDQAFSRLSGSEEVMTEAAAQAEVMETLGMPGGAVWKITNTIGELIGVAETAFVPPPHTAWIAFFLIRKAYQRQGYGTEAADLLERFLFAEPEVTSIGLGVLVENVAGTTFWKNRAYEVGMRRRDQHLNEIMTLRLRRSERGSAD
jgi:RimJ/RimL family protein N-acetyltransferase